MGDDADAVFRALADRRRRGLLDALHAENGQTLGELCRHLDMSSRAVSKHLSVLERASVVVTFWRGREKLYDLNPVPRVELHDRWIGKYERHRARALQRVETRAGGVGRRVEGLPTTAGAPERRITCGAVAWTCDETEWLANGEHDPVRGTVTPADSPWRLVMTWTFALGAEHPPTRATRVIYHIDRAGPENVKLTVAHEPLEEGSDVNRGLG